MILKSDKTDELFDAFVGFHAELEAVGKDKKVNAGKVRYKYAELSSLQDYARPILAKHGLAVTQLTTQESVVSMLVHKSGQFLGGQTKILLDSSGAKAQGSAITYARRYGYAALLDLAQEDDDGQAADGYPGIKRGKQNPKAGASTSAQTASGEGHRSKSRSQRSSASEKTSSAPAAGDVESLRKILSELSPEDRDGHMDVLNKAKANLKSAAEYRAFKAEVTEHFAG